MSKGSCAPRHIPLQSLTHCASSDSMSAHIHTIRAYPFVWHTLLLHLSMYLTFMYQCSIYKLGQCCYFILQMRNRQTYTSRAQFKVSNLVNHTNSRAAFRDFFFFCLCLHVDIKIEILLEELLQDDFRQEILLLWTLLQIFFVNVTQVIKWKKLLLCLGNTLRIFLVKDGSIILCLKLYWRGYLIRCSE